MLLDETAKLPLPVMLLAVGAWPISSAAAGVATTTAPTARVRAVATVVRTIRRRWAEGRRSTCTGSTPSVVRLRAHPIAPAPGQVRIEGGLRVRRGCRRDDGASLRARPASTHRQYHRSRAVDQGRMPGPSGRTSPWIKGESRCLEINAPASALDQPGRGGHHARNPGRERALRKKPGAGEGTIAESAPSTAKRVGSFRDSAHSPPQSPPSPRSSPHRLADQGESRRVDLYSPVFSLDHVREEPASPPFARAVRLVGLGA